uniref:Uncharacterized protein n=1 Tax=uncultured marine virus TaxID=186617 RepID=A0A0F7L4Z1_9VIRU|nr:hypothetical protein [uncultured marine virus]
MIDGDDDKDHPGATRGNHRHGRHHLLRYGPIPEGKRFDGRACAHHGTGEAGLGGQDHRPVFRHNLLVQAPEGRRVPRRDRDNYPADVHRGRGSMG